ncbi:MAG: efflux RND transporter periplasmic adaptor subunit [Desulfomonile tiedjei]|nr:efflux RND transporter periplasmic adaptor subunit [Desulfomonile tiedjei]
MALELRSGQSEAVSIGATGPRPAPTPDDRERLIVLSLELSRRAVEAKTLEELYFLVTNDIRSLIEFDRCFLVTHMQGESSFVAAGNQAVLETTPKIHEEVTTLASHLKGLEKPLYVSNPADLAKVSDASLTEAMKDGVAAFMGYSGSTGFFCVPLNHNNETLGHLLLEYLDGKTPTSPTLMALIKLAPFLAAALAEKWMVHENPNLASLTRVPGWHQRRVLGTRPRTLGIVAGVLVLIAGLLFLLPFAYPVGGEAEIVPKDRHLAFCRMEGLVDKIHVTEGMHVQRGQVIATLDATELDHRINTAQRQAEMLNNEMVLLRKSSSQDLTKLAESQLVELKRKSVLAELEYLEWQKQFLNVVAPASGVVVTKQIETMVGKKFKPGESFCEIAVPGDLCVDMWVSEENVAQIQTGQNGSLYLNSEPGQACPIVVQEVAPRAEVLQRLGNVYRVRATIEGDGVPGLKVGMKGIGRIYTKDTNIYSAIGHRLKPRWNQFSLNFL